MKIKRRTQVALVLMVALLASGCLRDNPRRTLQTATNTSNVTMCEKLNDYRMRYNCTMQIALKSENSSMCQGLGAPDWTDECYDTWAVRSKDSALCDRISGSLRKQACYKRVEGAV
jgi:hypothetical protein